MNKTCETCKYDTNKKSNYETHLKSEHGINLEAKETQTKNIKQKDNEKYLKIYEKEKISYICEHCNLQFTEKQELDEHLKLNCKMNIIHNNIYKFNIQTFGKYLFPEAEKPGEVYIIQTEFNYNKFFKIGITNNLYTRISTYRTGCVYEPRLHYYFPTKDTSLADDKLKEKLEKFNVKREIYQGDVEYFKNEILLILTEINGQPAQAFKPEIKNNDIISCETCNKVFETELDLILHDHNAKPVFDACEGDFKNKNSSVQNKNDKSILLRQNEPHVQLEQKNQISLTFEVNNLKNTNKMLLDKNGRLIEENKKLEKRILSSEAEDKITITKLEGVNNMFYAKMISLMLECGGLKTNFRESEKNLRNARKLMEDYMNINKQSVIQLNNG